MSKPLIAAAGALVALSATAAHAREVKLEGTPAVVQTLYDCRQIADSAQRLACFDATAAALAKAEADKDIVFADRESMREARKGLFGFTLPKLKLFGNGDDENEPEEFKTLTSTIERTGEYQPGKWYFVLPDGARWEQIDSQVLYRDPARGEQIVIRKAAMGSYMANISGRHGMRVKRVQ
jgi:hypothetical protein